MLNDYDPREDDPEGDRGGVIGVCLFAWVLIASAIYWLKGGW